MKKGVLVIFLQFLFIAFSFSQVVNPVRWSWKAEPTGKGEYKLIFTATISKPWHVYTQYLKGEGPIPTSFTYDAGNKDVQLVGKNIETGSKVHDVHDPMFDMDLKYYEEEMVCTQNIKVFKDTKLKGVIECMACDDKSCTPPQNVDFEFDLKGGATRDAGTPKDTAKTHGGVTPPNSNVDSSNQAATPPTPNHTAGKVAPSGAPCGFGKNGFSANYFGEPVRDCGKQVITETIWDVILEGILWGFIAVFTPCVFPMIPLTVSFFTKRAESQAKGKVDAFIYAGSIVLIYFLFSMPFVLLGASQNTLNDFSTNPYLNVGFFVVFVVFAFSFFGFYEITLPSFLVNKTDQASNTGGVLGIFFMALTLVLVSFSCTGPILGTLIGNVYNSGGGKIKLMTGFISFGVAIALPFAVFSLFPSLMKKLPRSGGWMNTFKVVLGFIELILAVKFLANADNVSHWGYLKREIFLGLWAVLGFGLFMYLIGVFKFAKEHSDGKISWGRYGLSTLVLLFSVYSGYGMYCHDVPLFSGFPPPKNYSSCSCNNECPLDLNCYHNYCEALEASKRENKPIMIDFTGWACVSCRRMEENVWSKPEVYKILSEEYILLSLYVDDRGKLPEGESYFSPTLNKMAATVGEKWSDLEITSFKNNTQPLYALISPTERLLNAPQGYTPEAADYLKWLNCGLEAHKELQK